ncbi:MAG: SpoIID/LytB domain-containing protein [Acidimicrobiales bacterium]|nr:SpoIID/LytB domain-containing protein [Acidimicrobiales bacterium]
MAIRRPDRSVHTPSLTRRVIAVVAALGVVFGGAAPAAAQPVQTNDTIAVTGHGWGHGRGMSQYGAHGYAVDYGWTSDQILDHYYGGTVAGAVPNDLLTVRIDSANGLPTVAQVDSGLPVLIDANDQITHTGTGRALRLTATTGGFILADAPTCAGPFVDRPDVVPGEQLRISSVSAESAGGAATVGAGTPVVGDWDGDGDDDLGVVNGDAWKLWNEGPDNATDTPDFAFTLDPAGQQIVVGDWGGNGVDTPGLFSDGTWLIRDGLDPADGLTTLNFGQAGDTGLVGDWDGDGDDDLGLRRSRSWLLRGADGSGPADILFDFGRINDLPVVGDWDGDGTTDVGVVRSKTWIRTTEFAEAGERLDDVVHVRHDRGLVGDWNGDGTQTLGAHDGAGEVDLSGPGATFGPRLDPNVPLAHTIQRCVSSSEQRYYRGELRAIHNGGNQRTVTAVPVESYLRAVVPLEMPASWSPAAVQSQAVSARSYSLAENRTSYARTCDTISCQVYGGRSVRRNGTLSSNEHPLSDAAIAATAGIVRMRDGEVARTEFSSSTGGWTAGGVFPAVEDLGDAVSINPNHDWDIALSTSTVEARFSGRSLTRLEVTARNGLGQDGGRVEEVTLTFGPEVFTMTGNEFRRAFGLKSDWFTVDWGLDARRSDCVCPDAWPDHGLDELFLDGQWEPPEDEGD